jgi:hypothetical protein
MKLQCNKSKERKKEERSEKGSASVREMRLETGEGNASLWRRMQEMECEKVMHGEKGKKEGHRKATEKQGHILEVF